MADATPAWFKPASIPGMLVFGTSTVVIQKIIFSMSAVGREGESHLFEKPWFQTLAMFWGMGLCLVVYEINSFIKKRKEKEYSLLNGDNSNVNSSDRPASSPSPSPEQPGADSKWRKYVYVLAPALCDFSATALMNIGLVWLAPSIWQMLRGSMVIFSAILSVIFLKRKLQLFHYTGIGIITIALILVAVSCIYGDFEPEKDDGEEGDKKVDTGLVVAGVLLVVSAQVIQASQIVIEEFLLKNVNFHPFLIVGLEGFWGSIVNTLILIPIYFVPVPSSDPKECKTVACKFHEDTLDTFVMLGNSGAIVGTCMLYVIAILGYNLFGMLVTQAFTAIHRTILEAVRTACIWLTNLFIYYAISSAHHHFGEKWDNKWSMLELFGFTMLLVGLFVYNKVIKLPAYFYSPELEVKTDAKSEKEKELARPLVQVKTK